MSKACLSRPNRGVTLDKSRSERVSRDPHLVWDRYYAIDIKKNYINPLVPLGHAHTGQAREGYKIQYKTMLKYQKEKEISLLLRKRLRWEKPGVCNNAFQIIYDPEILKIAYETIKSNPGNMVRGTDKTTLDGITEKWFHDTSKDLQTEAYKPKPARRIYIPKANNKMRPLGISSPRDKIIQQATRIVMEEVLERTFHNEYSHGFRPKRGCHSARRASATHSHRRWEY
jgi:hypothetical protein